MADSFTVLDIETTGPEPWLHHLVAVGLGKEVHISDGHEEFPGGEDPSRALVRELLAKDDSVVVCHTNFDLRWMLLDGAVLAEGLQYHDTKVLAFMLDASQEFALDSLAQKYLGYSMDKRIRKIAGQILFTCDDGKLVPIEESPWEQMERYNRGDIETTAALYVRLRDLLQQTGQWDYFLEEEAPFSKLLIEMEVTGLPMDAQACQEKLEGASAEREQLEADLVKRSGVYGLNLKSGDQVASYLYDELPTFYQKRLPIPLMMGVDRRDKYEAVQAMYPNLIIRRLGNTLLDGEQTVAGRGLKAPKNKLHSKDMRQNVVHARPPIDAENLSIMHGGDPWVTDYLRWKSLNTLCTNYLEKWVESVHDGRLHSRFDQARAETGRVVSRDPNLQSVPAVGGSVRHLFKAPMVIGDYNGLDARMAAHFSGDELMCEIFRNGEDLYGTLASNAWGGPAGKTNPRRSLMKILFLSIQYSAAAGSLSDKMRTAGLEKEARQSKQLLANLEDTLPRLFQWKEEVLRKAQTLGYITTIAGRRRQLPNLDSPIWKIKAREERKAVASTVQGSSADIVRRCMLAIREEIDPEAARFLLQIHDEILWERGPAWTPDLFDKIVDMAENAHRFELKVPMSFAASLAESWEDKAGEGARSYRTMVMAKGV